MNQPSPKSPRVKYARQYIDLMFDGCRTSFRFALRHRVQSCALEFLDCTWRDLAQGLAGENSKQRTHPKAIMFPRALVILGPIKKRALTKLIVCRIGIADNFVKSIVPNCLPYLPSNTSRLILISACSASYLVRASGIGPRYLWFPKSYHHVLPLFLTVKEHHLRSAVAATEV